MDIGRITIGIKDMSSKKRQLKKFRKQFREDVFSRDKNCCAICGSKENLDAHHITDRHRLPCNGYVRSNGITLCPIHHLMAEKYHKTNGREWEVEFHPDDLYWVIGSSLEKVKEDCEKLHGENNEKK
jgi:predicted restriction endonuclease